MEWKEIYCLVQLVGPQPHKHEKMKKMDWWYLNHRNIKMDFMLLLQRVLILKKEKNEMDEERKKMMCWEWFFLEPCGIKYGLKKKRKNVVKKKKRVCCYAAYAAFTHGKNEKNEKTEKRNEGMMFFLVEKKIKMMFEAHVRHGLYMD
eukprot:UN12201